MNIVKFVFVLLLVASVGDALGQSGIVSGKVAGPQDNFGIPMDTITLKLDEIVVTAIGVSRAVRALGYSVQSVESKMIVHSATTNLINALSGRVAGVQITSTSGAAGAASYMTIRGVSSVTGNNQPLFVIDGMPIDNSQLTSGDPDAGGNNLLYGVALSNRIIDINPGEIETVNILRSGAASALYGMRAANGVVVITTKKGVATGTNNEHVAFNSSVTFDRVSQLEGIQKKYAQGFTNSAGVAAYNPVTTANWGPLLSDLRFDGASDNPYYVQGNIVPVANAPAGAAVYAYDNIGNFFKTGISVNNSLSMSGGNQNTTFCLSLANSNNKGVVPDNTFKRTNVTLSGKSKISEKFSAEARVGYSNSGGDRIQQGANTSGVMLALMRLPLNFDITGGSGDPVNDKISYALPDGRQRNGYQGQGYDNPFWSVNMNRFNDDVNRLIGSITLNYLVNKWLTVTYRAGTDCYSDRRKQYFALNSRTAPAGRIYEEQYFMKEFNSDLLLNIHQKISQDFTFTALMGQNMYQSQWQRLFVQGDGLNVPEFYQLSNASSIKTRETKDKKRTAALYADIGLSYKNLLYLNVTGRNEWSTTLPEGENSFFFPSFNGSLVFTELPALKNIKAMPFGKLRASYAIIANDAFTYGTLPTYIQAAYSDGWTDGVSFPGWGIAGFQLSTTLPGNTLKPELLKSFEAGFDLRLLNDRIGLFFTFYNNKNEDLILSVPVAGSSGFFSANMNAASMLNKGVEITVTAAPVQKKNFNWNIDINFTRNVNKVLELAPGVDNVVLAGPPRLHTRAVVGQSYGSLFGNDWARDENGNILIVDDPGAWNYGYPKSDPKEINLGNVMPNWTMGINNTVSYKNIMLNFLIDIKNGGVMWNGSRGAMYYSGTHIDTESRGAGAIYVFDGVKSDGSENDIKVAKDVNWYFNGEGNSFTGPVGQFVEKTDWVRLREISLSYRLNKIFLNKTFLHSSELFFTGRNLWLSTPYSGIDPETSLTGAGNGQGIENFNMPGTRSYTFGFRLAL
ncbi:MAG: SusC/RagA family TonB-linked outer membrane protein [Bacteroidota bacterium]